MFPSANWWLFGQWQGSHKLQAEKIVSIRRGGTKCFGVQGPSGSWQQSHRRHRSAWDLQPNLRNGRQSAANRNQHPSGAHVQRGGKFEKFFALSVSTADKHGDGQREPGPLPPLISGPRPVHADLSIAPSPALQTAPRVPNPTGRSGTFGSKPGCQPPKDGHTGERAADFGCSIRLFFALSKNDLLRRIRREVQAFATLG